SPFFFNLKYKKSSNKTTTVASYMTYHNFKKIKIKSGPLPTLKFKTALTGIRNR
ncbi:hypothetical protein STEG23_029161, partial [Scotinomys teguina]